LGEVGGGWVVLFVVALGGACGVLWGCGVGGMGGLGCLVWCGCGGGGL